MKKIFTLCFLLASLVTFSQSTTLVISQVFGGSGTTGTYNADFVELKNISSTPISLAGYSIQYGSAGVTGNWSGVYALPASATIPAGGYYLIQMTSASTSGLALPAPDAVANPTINMSGTNGRVALSNAVAALSACPTATVIDKIGYGTASCFEGAASAAALTTTTAAFRKNNGCQDTDNNSTDFDVATPSPRNSVSTASTCSGGPVASLTASPTTIAGFGSINVGVNSTSSTFSLSGANLTGFPGNITVTAPSTNFQVSNNNSSWGASTTVAYTSATLAATTVYVRFTPQSAGSLSGNVSIAGGGGSAMVAVSGTGVSIVPGLGAATVLASFGNVCANTTTGPNSFILTGTNLTTADITVGPLNGYTFSSTSGGTYAASITLTQTGGTYSQDIFVKFTPTAVQSYNGDIPVSGGGASTAIGVPATGAAVNLPPTETTGAANTITATGAVLAATIDDAGCTALTTYGIEYSTTNGFANGSGTQVASSNLSAGNYSSSVSGLVPSATYYYKAYATNGGGTSYGAQRSFTTLACASPTVATDTLQITTGYYDAVVGGSVIDTGCSNVTVYGIEYSSIAGFANGKGIKVYSTNASSGYTAQLSGLLPNTKYYFKAFATNNGGTGYGVQDTLKTKLLPSGLVVYSVPAVRGQLLHYSMDNAPRAHYTVQLTNSVGQVVYRKDVKVQVGFIDDWFLLPSTLQTGVYTLSVLPDGKERVIKTILVQ